MTNRTRLVAVATAAVVLLAAGIFVVVRLSIDAVNGSIPQADLFSAGTSSTTTTEAGTPSQSPTGEPDGSDIKGPLNILIAGQDTREYEPGSLPHADTVVIMHITADLKSAYLTSLPRDMLVNIPAFAPSGTGAEYTKLTHAMTYGARTPGSGGQDIASGFALLAQTVSGFTGIDHFDAGAVVSFLGLSNLIDLIGGIELYVDQYVESIHMAPNGQDRQWCPSCEHQYAGPSATYQVGMQTLAGWQVLDYARQRYGLPNGAYDRERHHRQIVKAMISKIVTYGMEHPFVAGYVVQRMGHVLTLDLRGRTIAAWAWALRNLRPENITLVGLPGSAVFNGGAYQGETLAPVQAEYFAAMRADNLGAFVAAHPELVNATP